MKRMAAVFNQKDLCADGLRDDVFSNCYEASDSEGHHNHLISYETVDDDEIFFNAIIDVQWEFNTNTIRIELLACPCPEDFFGMRDDFFKYYEKVFKEWERGLIENSLADDSAEVTFKRDGNVLYVSFWWLINE